MNWVRLGFWIFHGFLALFLVAVNNKYIHSSQGYVSGLVILFGSWIVLNQCFLPEVEI